MVAGREATESDKVPIAVEGGVIENVEEFPYLGSVIASSGTVDTDVETRKCQVYDACVLAVLLYGSEC